MNRTLVDTLAEQIVSYICEHVGERLYNVVNESQDNGTFDEETIPNELKKLLSEMPKTRVSPTSNNTSVSNISTPAAKPSSRSAGALTDESGQERICEEIVKKTGIRCAHKAKHHINGKYLCGVHAKSANNTQPDSNHKPGARNNTPGKTTSTFTNIIGNSSSITDSFSLGDDILE